MSAAVGTAAPVADKYDPKAYVLRISSIKDEYYCGDLQGTLQLRKDPHELVNLNTDDLPDDSDKAWTIDEVNAENSARLMRKNMNATNHELLCVTRNVGTDGTIWLKGAVLNKSTNLIALLTSTNNRARVDRPLDSHDPTYVIGHYRMCAPKIFWVHLKETLKARGYGSTD